MRASESFQPEKDTLLSSETAPGSDPCRHTAVQRLQPSSQQRALPRLPHPQVDCRTLPPPRMNPISRACLYSSVESLCNKEQHRTWALPCRRTADDSAARAPSQPTSQPTGTLANSHCCRRFFSAALNSTTCTLIHLLPLSTLPRRPESPCTRPLAASRAAAGAPCALASSAHPDQAREATNGSIQHTVMRG